MAINACTLPIQSRLSSIYQQPEYMRIKGILSAIVANQSGTMQAQMVRPSGLAKDKVYQLTWLTPECSAPVDCSTVDCTTAATPLPLEQMATFSGMDCKTSSWKKITAEQFDSLCQATPNELLVQWLRNEIDKIRKAVNDEWKADLCTAVGCIKTGLPTRTLQFIDPTTKVAKTNTIPDILMDFEDAGYVVNPYLIGGRQLRYYNSSVANGLGNFQGQNIGGLDTLQSYYETGLEAVCPPASAGNEVVLAVMPGIFQYVNWSDNAGVINTGTVDPNNLSNAITNVSAGNEIHGIFVDPITGMVFDIDVVKPSPKCADYEMIVKLQYKLHKMPLVGCGDSCFTGVVKYDICPTTAVAC